MCVFLCCCCCFSKTEYWLHDCRQNHHRLQDTREWERRGEAGERERERERERCKGNRQCKQPGDLSIDSTFVTGKLAAFRRMSMCLWREKKRDEWSKKICCKQKRRERERQLEEKEKKIVHQGTKTNQQIDDISIVRGRATCLYTSTFFLMLCASIDSPWVWLLSSYNILVELVLLICLCPQCKHTQKNQEQRTQEKERERDMHTERTKMKPMRTVAYFFSITLATMPFNYARCNMKCINACTHIIAHELQLITQRAMKMRLTTRAHILVTWQKL